MSRFLKLLSIVAILALIAVPAFAEVQNVKVSGDVDSGGVYRTNYDLMSTNQPSVAGSDDNVEDQNFLFTQARVRVDADLTDNVATCVRLLAEYDWNTEDNTGADASSTNADGIDLDLANVTLKEMFYQPLSVTVGRQELRYGNAFVIGDPDTNTTSVDTDLAAGDLSLRKSFDAIKAVVDYSPLVVDLFYAKMDETATRIASPTITSGDDEDLYGINAKYDVGSYNSEIEAYWLYKVDREETTTFLASSDSSTPGQKIHTIGIRGSVTPIDKLNLMGEIAVQRGEYDDVAATKRDQSANAFQVAGGYTFPDVTIPYVKTTLANPMVKLGWTHYSGEEVTNTGDYEAWIPLYEDQTHGIVANHILGGVNGGQNSNADILNVGGSLSPLQDLTLSVDFYKFWLDEKLAAGNNDQASNGTGLQWTNLTESSYRLKADDDLGYEIDLGLKYDYTEDVKMGLSAGWFKPGDAFDGASGANSNDETAIEVLAKLDVAF